MNNETSTTIGALTFGVKSSEGQRPNQEDRWEARAFETADGQTAVLALVADGIGGGKGGEMASFLAKETVREYVLAQRPTTSLIPAALVKAFQEANRRIYAEAEKDPSLAGMGTTCTAVVIVGYRLYLAHVGDTRAYLVRGDKITQLSVDHSFAEELRRLGRPEEEIRQHPNRHVIKRYLGIDPEMKIDTHYRSPDGGFLMDSMERPLSLQDGDTLLLCSDGLTDVLEDQQILSVLRGRRAPQAASALVEQALKAPLPAGKEKDNITALVFNLPGWRRGGLALSRVLPAAGAVVLIIAAVAIAAFLLAREYGYTVTPPPTLTKAVVQVVETATPMETKRATATLRPASPTQTAPVGVLSVTPTAIEPPTVTPVVFTPTVTPTATLTEQRTVTRGKAGKPELLEPACEQWLDSNKIKVAKLKWSYGLLGKGERFEVRIWREDDKAKIRRVSTSLSTYEWEIEGLAEGLAQGSQKWYWQVAVVRGEPPGKTEVLSESKECWFGWGPCKRKVLTTCTRVITDPATGDQKTEEYSCENEEDCP